MSGRKRDARSVLRELTIAVDADAGARLYLDRGDGILELAIAYQADPLAPPPSSQERLAGLARWLRARGPEQPEPPSEGHGHEPATLHIVLPTEQLGILELARHRHEPFSEDDVAIARVHARSLGGRVRTRMTPRRHSWSSQMEAVQAVAAQLTRLTTVEAISLALCTQTRRVVSFDNARVYVVGPDGQSLEPVAFRPHAPEYQGESKEGLRLRVGEGITGWVAATGQAQIVPDTAHDPRGIDVPDTDQVQEESMLLAPLRSERRVIGVVALSALGLDRFSEGDLRLVGVLADQAAVAIENARLTAARERHVAELATLLEISQASSRASDEGGLADVLSKRLLEASGMERCTVYRWDGGTGQLHALSTRPARADAAALDGIADRVTRSVLTGGPARHISTDSEDISTDDRIRLATLGARSLVLLPLAAAGRVIGLVELSAGPHAEPMPEGRMDLLRTMANHSATALENARLLEQLRNAAELDLVSGVSSHRHLQDRIRQEMARAARARSSLSVLMLDLDDFKLVNDRHGHQVGDMVLRSVAGTLRSAVRAQDVVGRYGGDEFVVLMPDTDAEQARQVAHRAAIAIAGQVHHMPDGSLASISCSLGMATYPNDGRTGTALLRAADSAMYAQKRARRGSVRTRGHAPGEGVALPTADGPEVQVSPQAILVGD